MFGRLTLRSALACVVFSVGLAVTAVAISIGARQGARQGELVAQLPLITHVNLQLTSMIDPKVAKVRFPIKNVGGKQVRIVSMSSGCGCAVPKIEPKVIEPGKTGYVEVEAASPLIGEKLVTITLETDSAKTPILPLQLRLVGGGSPPFLLSAEGDLSYHEDIARSKPRQIEVLTIEKGA